MDPAKPARPAKRAGQPAAKPAVKAGAKPARPAVKAAAKPVKPTVKSTKPVKKAAGATARRRPAPAVPEAAAAPAPEPVAPPEPVVAPPAVPPPPPPRAWAAAEFLGEAEERDPNEPVVPLAPRAPGVLDDLFEPSQDDGRWPLPLRIVRGDWRPALLAALPAVVATVIAAAVGASTLLIAEGDDGEELFEGTTAGRWVRYVATAVGLAFGTSVRAKSDGRDDVEFGGTNMVVRFVPLTVTLVGLAVLWLGIRRAQGRSLTPDRVADAVRTAAVFAAGLAVVSWFGRWEVGGQQSFDDFGEETETTLRFSTAPLKVLFWAFAIGFLVVWLAGRPFRFGDRAAAWLLALRGALVGLAAGIATSFVVLVGLAFFYADEVGNDAGDVFRAIPLAIGYGLNLATGVFGVASGGEFGYPIADRADWSLWSDQVPDWYLLLLLVPLLSAVAAAFYVTRRSGAAPALAVRACALMAYPAAFVWLVLAVAGTAHMEQFGSFGFGYLGAFRAGPRLWDALLVGLWFGAVGWPAGRLLVRQRPEPAFDPAEYTPVP